MGPRDVVVFPFNHCFGVCTLYPCIGKFIFSMVGRAIRCNLIMQENQDRFINAFNQKAAIVFSPNSDKFKSSPWPYRPVKAVSSFIEKEIILIRSFVSEITSFKNEILYTMARCRSAKPLNAIFD